ncbi:MAG: O-antigen ligase family protein [Phycisphaerae bacterium]
MNADFLTTQDDRVLEPAARRPRLNVLERVVTVIAVAGLAASCWLISSGGGRSEEGAIPWRPGSLLQMLTQMMALNFEHPTARGYEVKWLTQGLAGMAGLLAGVIGWFVSARRAESAAEEAGRPRRVWTLRQRGELLFSSLTPTNSAQMAFLLFAGWSFLSAWWSPWPAGSAGEAFRQLIPIVFAIVLGRTLSPRGARAASALIAGVLALTAVIALWYYYERNPVQRLKFPIGNPIFLGAVMLPGVVLPLAFLASAAVGAMRAKPAAAATATATLEPPSEARQGWWLVAAGAGLLLTGWALALTGGRWLGVLYGSRGPVIGLGAGLATIIYLVAPKRARWVVLALAGVALTAVISDQVGKMELDAARGSTVRFRFYAWRIAVDRFVTRPVGGGGQGSYSLGAQSQALDDFVNDPAAFPTEKPALDHAHNEWLEILADLGAAGFALVSTALGATFWAAGLAMKRLRHPADRACLLGLAGSLAALIAEEALSLGLHKPVIPLLFYSLIGLIWSLARSTEKHPWRQTAPPPGKGLRLLGLLAGLAGAAVTAWLVIADWQGARAEYRIQQFTEKKDWRGALEQAAQARSMRLGIDDRILATRAGCIVNYQAAGYWLNELTEVFRRAGDADGLTAARLAVARECAERFDEHVGLRPGPAGGCLQWGQEVWSRLPFFPDVAGVMAEALLLCEQRERLEAQVGLREQAHSYVSQAREWFKNDYLCNRLNAGAALRLLEFTPREEPLIERANLLRVPLRAGPMHPSLKPLLAGLMQDSGFESLMNDWLKGAQVVLSNPGAIWADPFAPETLRLAALCEEVLRDRAFSGVSSRQAAERTAEAAARMRERAVPQAQAAADLLLGVRARYPATAAFARADQARYELLSTPDNPAVALATYRQALTEWMAGGLRDDERALRADLATFLLAAGREEEAVESLKTLFGAANPRAVEEQLTVTLLQLGQWFIVLPPQARPKGFDGWVARLLELAPASPFSLYLAAQVALEQGNHQRAFELLDALADLDGGRHIPSAVNRLQTRFPDDAALQEFIRQRTAQTQPAESTTRPATPATGVSPTR